MGGRGEKWARQSKMRFISRMICRIELIFLGADSDSIIFGLTANLIMYLWSFKCRGFTVVLLVLLAIFQENVLFFIYKHKAYKHT